MRAFALLLLIVPSLGGCYLSHERPTRSDAGTDASIPRDAPILLPDVPPVERCERLVIAHEVALEGLATGSVTPRVTAIDGGGVALAYVRSDGDPTRVIMERRDRDLEVVTPARELSTTGFSWAEVALHDGRLLVAYADGEGTSTLRSVVDDASDFRRTVPLEHPSILLAAGSIFWATFEMRSDNALVMARLNPRGEPVHPLSRIELGRYGSGHHGVVAPDDTTVVLGYPREDGRGVRHGFVRAVDERGELGPEHRISDEDITQVWPLRDEEAGTLVVVANGDSLYVERRDWDTLEVLAAVVTPPIEGPFVAAMVRGHVVVARLASGRLQADVYDESLSITDTLTEPMPGTLGVGASVAEVPDGMVVAVGVSSGETFPWLARIECAD